MFPFRFCVIARVFGIKLPHIFPWIFGQIQMLSRITAFRVMREVNVCWNSRHHRQHRLNCTDNEIRVSYHINQFKAFVAFVCSNCVSVLNPGEIDTSHSFLHLDISRERFWIKFELYQRMRTYRISTFTVGGGISLNLPIRSTYPFKNEMYYLHWKRKRFFDWF